MSEIDHVRQQTMASPCDPGTRVFKVHYRFLLAEESKCKRDIHGTCPEINFYDDRESAIVYVKAKSFTSVEHLLRREDASVRIIRIELNASKAPESVGERPIITRPMQKIASDLPREPYMVYGVDAEGEELHFRYLTNSIEAAVDVALSHPTFRVVKVTKVEIDQEIYP